MTAVFQNGFGAKAIGLNGAIPIVPYVPMMMFAILFGLSMDYQVFLLSRVREETDAGQSARRAVIDGLAGTGKVIASAAAIMVAVFASFILNGDPTVKEFGVGLASAILIAGVTVCVLFASRHAHHGRPHLVATTLAGPPPAKDQYRRGGGYPSCRTGKGTTASLNASKTGGALSRVRPLSYCRPVLRGCNEPDDI